MRLAAALAAFLLLACPGAHAQGERQAAEHEVKAAFLFKFPAFVEWPGRPGPEDPFVIAVAGAPEVAEELRMLARGRTLNGRPIAVREPADPQGAAGAHMVFVGGAAGARLPHFARALAGTSALLVAETPGALEHGAMLNFVVSEGRVRFDVAVDAAEASRLRINA
ncbi:MAG TPA: YfiR family protein, partial [Burkholderiales bacterium]|nr:YfiR family protein [Burkholderiales bacterium]